MRPLKKIKGWFFGSLQFEIFSKRRIQFVLWSLFNRSVLIPATSVLGREENDLLKLFFRQPRDFVPLCGRKPKKQVQRVRESGGQLSLAGIPDGDNLDVRAGGLWRLQLGVL
jgi:hypothetical protein